MLPAPRPRLRRVQFPRLRRTVLTVLAVTLVVTSSTGAEAASPEQVLARADTTAQAARNAAGESTVRLTRGTAAWEAGTAELARVQTRAAAARALAAESEARRDDAQNRLGDYAAALYRNPVSPELAVVLNGDGADLPAALNSLAMLGRAGSSAGATLDTLKAAGHRARQAAAEHVTLVERAATQTATLAAQMASLQADAAATVARLDAAEAALTAAKATIATQQAAAAAARAQASAAARAQAAAASRSSRVPEQGAGAAGCSGASTSGYRNGAIPPEALCPLNNAPGHRLRGDAAAAYNGLTAAAASERGAPLCVTDSYRSYSEQVDVYRRKPGLAATPGTSNHGWGVAVDLSCGAESFGSSTYRWLKANAGGFGWTHPSWAEPGGSKPEPWHWEYTG